MKRTWPEDAGFDGRGAWPPAKEGVWPLEMQKRQGMHCAPELPERSSAADGDVLTSAQRDTCWTCDLRNCRIVSWW